MAMEDVTHAADAADLESEEEDVQLTWSRAYIMLCLLLPTFSGFMNSYCWAGLSLHYADMGWAVSRSGAPTSIGFLLRIVFQEVQMRCGFWVAIPLGLLHLATAIVGCIFPQEEWAVWLEVIFLMALDPAITVEGLAFDSFGLSEDLARQASSTVLAVFIIAVAASVTIGGFIYDLGGWQAMSCFHVVCQVIFLFIILLQPAVYKSFRAFWFEAPEEEVIPEPVVPQAKVEDLQVDGLKVHNLKVNNLKVKDFKLEDLKVDNLTGEDFKLEDLKVQDLVENLKLDDKAEELDIPGLIEPALGGREVSGSQGSAEPRRPSGRTTTHSRATARSRGTTMSRTTQHSRATQASRMSKVSALTRLTKLTESEDLQYHFAATACLTPMVARPSGQEKKLKGIPKDLRVPMLLVVVSTFCNGGAYCTCFSTFAIFFKEYHGWNSAIWASLAQTSGDLAAAIMMKVLPNGVEETGDVAWWKRLLMQPYNISCLLLSWVLCSAGMTSPWLPLAISAQVLMGTVFVYVVKFSTDLNLFYSLGDTDLFLSLQVWCKNSHALAACLFGFLGPYLFETVNPFFPFLVTTCMAFAAFAIFTAGFGYRVGWLDIETAEAQRSRRLGMSRTSRWTVVSRRTEN